MSVEVFFWAWLALALHPRDDRRGYEKLFNVWLPGVCRSLPGLLEAE